MIKKYLFQYKYKELEAILKKLNVFEKEIGFDEKLPIILSIANSLIVHNHYRLAVVYLKFLNIMHTSNILRKIYRLFKVG